MGLLNQGFISGPTSNRPLGKLFPRGEVPAFQPGNDLPHRGIGDGKDIRGEYRPDSGVPPGFWPFFRPKPPIAYGYRGAGVGPKPLRYRLPQQFSPNTSPGSFGSNTQIGRAH